MHKPLQMGWLRDLPDFRDETFKTDSIKKIRTGSKAVKAVLKSRPGKVDLSEFCSPIEDQELLSSCTANAGVALLEFYERRTTNTHIEASRLFLYKASRNLLGWTEDDGSYLRTTMKAMVLFGVPPEKFWPYDINRFKEEPPAFCYAFASNYKTLKYYRLDPPSQLGTETLEQLLLNLAAGLPVMFGFTVYNSIPGIGSGTGDIPMPQITDSATGGHAVVAVGYDDDRKIGKEKGALLIRNSWGVEWGEAGYGWLPYSYITKGLAADFWSLISANFVDTEPFDRG